MKSRWRATSSLFKAYRLSVAIRSPYAPPLKPLKFQRFFKFLKWLDLVGCDWIFAPTHDTLKVLKFQCFEGVCSLALVGCAGLPCLVQTPSGYTELITVFVYRLTEVRIQTGGFALRAVLGQKPLSRPAFLKLFL